MLLQIEEENILSDEILMPKTAIGIDLGTTHTVISVFKNGKVEIIPFEGDVLIPSVIGQKNETVVVGKKAIDINDAVHSVKRHMHTPLFIKGYNKNIIELTAEILKTCKNVAQDFLDESVFDAVITVPAYFDDTQRQATKDAASLAGLNVLRLLSEPTAAALSYGLDNGNQGLYLVYDLGGGTFDVSLLKFNKGVFQVIATGGDTTLGGDDVDFEIITALNLEDTSLNRLKARQIKHTLSANKPIDEPFSQDDLSKIIKPFIDKTLKICDHVLKDTHYKNDDLLGVILVGGSTRLWGLKDALSKHFKKEIRDDLNPDLCVSKGAALQAHALTNEGHTLLLDVTPLSLGIETMGGMIEKIIHRNSPIPIYKAQDFTTYQDGQTALKIHVLQGEREMIKDCQSLCEFILTEIPAMPAGMARIRVTFALDADGLLNVSAEELHTKKKQVIEVKPSYGLTKDALEKMIYDAHYNAKEDIENRLLQESIVQTKHLIKVVKKAVMDDGDLLNTEQRQLIDNYIDKINNGINSLDRAMIEDNKDKLAQITQEFAEKRLERSIAKALVGQEL